MADRGTVVLQSTSLEGNAVISIRGFVPLGMGVETCGRSVLGTPTTDQLDDWYGDSGAGAFPLFIEHSLFPVNTFDIGGQTHTQTRLNAFGTELPRSVTLQRQNTAGPTIIYVREWFYYLEDVDGWDGQSLRITRIDGDGSLPFAITCSTVGATRDEDGFLYDYSGAPNYLATADPDPGPTAFEPTRGGIVYATEETLAMDESVVIPGPLRGRAIFFQVSNHSPSNDFTEFTMELA